MISALLLSTVIAPVAQPNIVVIFTDDAGYGDFGFTGSTQIKTPNIDSIASDGVFFSRGYVAGSVCSPSRAGLLTGKYPARIGHEYNLGKQPFDNPDDYGLPLKELTIANALQDVGYTTGLIGKWHQGGADNYHPTKRGFDEFWGLRGGSRSYWNDKVSRQQKIENNFGASNEVTYVTDNIGEQAVSFIKRHSEDPFFLFVSFTAPHAPMHAKEEDLARFDWIEDKKRRTYCAMVHAVDVQVGNILKSIDSMGMEENTIVVFLNDNGGPVPSNASLNAPYNGMKGTFLEGGIRVPFAIKWPGTLRPGRVYKETVSSLDLLPTLVTAAGGSPSQNLDGVNILPFIQGQDIPHDKLFFRRAWTASIIDGDWKLIRLPDRPALLFNLKNDPGEQVDLGRKDLTRVSAMLKDLADWERTTTQPIFRTDVFWTKYNRDHYDRQYELIQPANHRR